MKLRVIVVGKPDRKISQTLIAHYQDRLRPVWPMEIVPVAEERLRPGRDGADTMRREAERIRVKCPDGWPVITLDRTGRMLDSPSFANALRREQDSGRRGLCLTIGGPLGLARELVKSSHMAISFGPMTFPHDLALVMLCEQVYRAMTIVRGLPYHR